MAASQRNNNATRRKSEREGNPAGVCLCVCVCEREREKERENEIERKRGRERERKREKMSVCSRAFAFVPVCVRLCLYDVQSDTSKHTHQRASAAYQTCCLLLSSERVSENKGEENTNATHKQTPAGFPFLLFFFAFSCENADSGLRHTEITPTNTQTRNQVRFTPLLLPSFSSSSSSPVSFRDLNHTLTMGRDTKSNNSNSSSTQADGAEVNQICIGHWIRRPTDSTPRGACLGILFVDAVGNPVCSSIPFNLLLCLLVSLPLLHHPLLLAHLSSMF